MKIKKTKYGIALLNAGEEAYRRDIIETLMEENNIGEGKDFISKEDWVETKIEGWLL